jgi:hypothetical protein
MPAMNGNLKWAVSLDDSGIAHILRDIMEFNNERLDGPDENVWWFESTSGATPGKSYACVLGTHRSLSFQGEDGGGVVVLARPSVAGTFHSCDIAVELIKAVMRDAKLRYPDAEIAAWVSGADKVSDAVFAAAGFRPVFRDAQLGVELWSPNN